MHARTAPPLLLLLAILLAPPIPAAEESSAAAPSELARRLDRAIAESSFAQARVGMLVARAEDGEVLYARGADRLFIPASNQKILTALASLDRFGPAHRFTTRFHAPTAIDGEGELAELVVEGGGDPSLRSEDWWRIAADLRRAGLRVVHGDLRVDDGIFTGPSWHPSWGEVSGRAYHAPIGALNANFGGYLVSVAPRASAGSRAHVAIDPPVAYLRLSNRARTVGRATAPDLRIERSPGAASEGIAEEIVQVEGRVRRGDPADAIARSVIDPGLYAGALLLHQLEANGIEVAGRVRRSARGEADRALVLSHAGASLAEVVRACMKQSSNSVAETLVKDLAAFEEVDAEGRPLGRGDWAEGMRVVRERLEGLGIELQQARLVDGSGLSTLNRLSPRMLVAALRVAASSFRFGPEFVAALPIAHADGTLERRLEEVEGRVRAKTGLLSDAQVTALSGYAERPGRGGLVFSILVNGPGAGTESAMAGVDQLAAILLESP